MTTEQQHPITPPPELVQQWWTEFERADFDDDSLVFVATQAARWGWSQCMKLDHAWLEAKMQEAKDEELEACCEWLVCNYNYPEVANPLRAARRPQPPSLKEQALAALAKIEDNEATYLHSSIVRRALEQLPE